MGDLGDRLARGDQAAFAELYDACADQLHPFLVSRLGSRADADDVVQETFVRLAHARRTLADVDNLVAYVFTVARNEAARLLTVKRRESVSLTNQINAADLYREVSGDELEARDTAQALAQALARLVPEQREIVELKNYAELSLREIAEITGLPQGTVATRYRTAIGHLRDWLTRKCHE
jgi:RNA polymerase sigma-70 factor (ECF subfamily)